MQGCKISKICKKNKMCDLREYSFQVIVKKTLNLMSVQIKNRSHMKYTRASKQYQVNKIKLCSFYFLIILPVQFQQQLKLGLVDEFAVMNTTICVILCRR